MQFENTAMHAWILLINNYEVIGLSFLLTILCMIQKSNIKLY